MITQDKTYACQDYAISAKGYTKFALLATREAEARTRLTLEACDETKPTNFYKVRSLGP
jgi:hypothetical protein